MTAKRWRQLSGDSFSEAFEADAERVHRFLDFAAIETKLVEERNQQNANPQ